MSVFTFKKNPEPTSSQTLIISILIQVTTISFLDYLVISKRLPISTLDFLESVFKIVATVMLLEHNSNYVIYLFKFSNCFP